MSLLNSISLVGLGFLVGALGTLIGAGGGFILVPVLLLLYPESKPELITSISLAVVFLNASSGSVAYARMKRIDYKSAMIFASATLPGAVIGAIGTGYIPRHTFDIVLSILLLVISILLLLKPQQGVFNEVKWSKYHVSRSVTERSGTQHHYSFNNFIGIVLSFIVGFISSLLGIGGGIIHVPALTKLLNFPVHIATATSHLILACMALTGTIVHIIQGNFTDGWLRTLLIGFGVVVGAQLGAILSDKIKGPMIVRILAIALLLVAVRLFFQ
ncbi:MAG: sulfite exporter TauE/SafE family protein [Chitinophagaceae bacterium]|nr:sulfite exporter TauE/SafE family protein [Chitinophagaceae bacterium]